MCEHLTSESAKFTSASQTKLTAWLNAGVTASAGTVSEPYANWKKFPSAFYFCHYITGCTVIESFYQSVSSPLQVLFVGEPLAAPWAPRGKVEIFVEPSDDILSGKIKIITQVSDCLLYTSPSPRDS